MKLKFVPAIVAILSTSFFAQPTNACTGLRLIAKDGSAVVGRTLEFGFDLESNATVIPAGSELSSSLPDPSKGIHYTSKYGMVGANAFGKPVIVDGVNEKGLYVGAFYFPGYASYADPNPADDSRSLAAEDYATWLLANCSSVADVKTKFDKVILVPNPIQQIGGGSFPGHFVVHDGSGASVVIEPVDKALKIYDNPLGVITNSPSFDWHLTNLRNYINLSATNVPAVDAAGITLAQLGQGSGLRGLPGDYTPPSRFIRAVAFSQFAEKLPTAKETVPEVFHIMNAFDIPLGAVRDVEGKTTSYDYTVWTSVADLKNIRWDFRTHNDQSIRSIDVRKALAAAGDKIQTIKMDSDQPIIDVSTDFN